MRCSRLRSTSLAYSLLNWPPSCMTKPASVLQGCAAPCAEPRLFTCTSLASIAGRRTASLALLLRWRVPASQELTRSSQPSLRWLMRWAPHPRRHRRSRAAQHPRATGECAVQLAIRTCMLQQEGSKPQVPACPMQGPGCWTLFCGRACHLAVLRSALTGVRSSLMSASAL